MQQDYLGIKIDLSRDQLFDQLGLLRLQESYMKAGETSPQQRYAFVSKSFSSNPDHAQRLYDYASQHWVSFSTPILSFGRSERGMPISCFLPYLPDSSKGLVDTLSEVNWLSMLGGGVGIGIGIRASDEKSTGVLSHLKVYDASSLAYRQGTTRRGSYAAYLDISHPDIIPFLEIRKPTGDQNIRCLNLHHGVNITDDFMHLIEQAMLDPKFDDSWPLIDPNNNQVREVVSAKELWTKLIELRAGGQGEPYIHYIDASNRAMPECQKKLGLKIRQSNLCSEIVLPTDEFRTAVCCLSSVNLEYFDQWKDHPMFLRDIAEMLDNVLEYFIKNAPKEIGRAIYSASRERSIGVGALGFHAYLQQKNIPWESALAVSHNKKLFKHIRSKLDIANLELGAERGEAPDAVGTGMRFCHVMAIAPNASSSIICGNTSPSTEPYRANVYRQDTLSGAHTNKNKYLAAKIDEYIASQTKLTADDVWSSIMSNDGSVQHLDWLDDWSKDVFKTAMEIDQRWIIQHAADRQEYIDQAQSLNVFFRANANVKYVHAVHFMAWKLGLKTMYYCRSEKVARADKVSKQLERKVIDEIDLKSLAHGESDCLACE